MTIEQMAANNLNSHIGDNEYPGRGLVVGKMDNGIDYAMVYFIMGRSPNSQNRRFCAEGDRLWTEPVDPAKVEDPSLIIYDAMLKAPGVQLVSNGDQTKTIQTNMENGGNFMGALKTREREPDAPNFTPRISAAIDFRDQHPDILLSILKANKFDTNLSDRFTFNPAPPAAGFGYLLTTYMGNENPLPSYSGDPLIVPIKGTAAAILETYWGQLNADNRVSLAVKTVSATGATKDIIIKNRHS